jgi:enoyl-CoA hydratase/carnithine racemase
MTGSAHSADRQVSVEYRGAVAIARFANPPDGQIANKGAAQLHDAVAGLLADAAVRVIILAGGQEGIFIRHADVGQILRAGEALAAGHIKPGSFVDTPFALLGQLLDQASKPVIAAIDGVCMGGGLEIALACTMRIASPAACSIGLPEIRIGIFPGGGGTQRLPQLIGWHRARLFVLQGEVVDAAEALALGIVDELAPSALERALALAAIIASRPAVAVAAILGLMRPPAGQAELAGESLEFAKLLQHEPAVLAQIRQFLDCSSRLETMR